MKNNTNNKYGFTLIELLVVISIIGLMSSLAVVSLNSARIKARDALRKADMAQMRTALSLYYMDHNAYPICGSINSGPPDNGADYGATVDDNLGGGSWCYINTLKVALTSGSRPILQEMPVDPRNKNNKMGIPPAGDSVYIYRYASNADGSEYVLVYTLEEGGTVLQIIRGW
ncbi:MAG: prepilin-type N-terminal cleavage/methylation domain-containing protein [Candidatus Falkowbacteria bacterium]|nr:prepilin-type N-terminal cleavage/methylation domain-containing protein [Candidatus Falkowbacteria bacterium]